VAQPLQDEREEPPHRRRDGALHGGITVIQAAPVVERLGAQGLLGWAAGFTVLREIAPLLTALMISGRVGRNNAAELGTMVVTEQTDALRVLASTPSRSSSCRASSPSS